MQHLCFVLGICESVYTLLDIGWVDCAKIRSMSHLKSYVFYFKSGRFAGYSFIQEILIQCSSKRFPVREVRRLFFHPRDINPIVFIQEIGLADADAMDACMHACIQMYICIPYMPEENFPNGTQRSTVVAQDGTSGGVFSLDGG